MKATFFSSTLYKLFAALMIAMLVITALPVSQAQAAVTAEIVPTANGFYNTWANGFATIDEGTAAASCTAADSIATTTINGRESFVIPLTLVPDGSTITSIDVLIRDRGDTAAGGTYASFIRFNGTDSANSATHTVTGIAGGCTGSITDTFDVTDTVKGVGTTLEIGVIKLDAIRLRVGVLSAVITYNTPPTGGNGAVTTNEDTLYTFTTADFTTLTTPAYSDPESDPFSGIQVTSLETAGTLQCGGVDVPLNGTCADVTTLTFLPASNANGSPYATFGFKVYDGSFYSTSSYTMTINVTAVNDAPSFTKGADETVLEDAGAQTVAGWATAISDGDPELTQTLTFNVTGNTNAGLFSAGPAINATTGNLTYTPAANANGSATITITLSDNGGTANGGVDTSASQTSVVNVTAVNDAPSFIKGADETVLEDAGAQTVAGWATAISDGDPELTQTLTFNVTGNTNAGLFSAGPAIDATTGNLTYTPAANVNGSATITITLSDNGGTANSGANTSPSQTFVINVTAVNDAPTDITLDNNNVDENQTINTLVGNLSAIDPDTGDTFTFDLTCTAAGTDDTSFNISGTSLRTSASFDFETKNSYAICIRVTDQGGTGLSFDKNFTINVNDLDEIAPAVTIVSVSPDPTNAGTTLTWNADENGTYEVRVGATSCTDGTVVDSGAYTAPGNVATAILAGDLSVGSNSLFVCVTDAATDTGSDSSSVMQDTTAPNTSITSNPSNPDNNSATIFIFTSDEPSTFQCRLDAGAYAPCTSPVNLSGLLSDGPHTFYVYATDTAGNDDLTPASYTWIVDTMAPAVTVEQASGQADPTNTSPINFTVTFGKPINTASFTTADVILGGTAPGTLVAVLTEVAPNDGTTFNVAVSGMTGLGTVTAAIPANVVQDPLGNNNTVSTSLDNTVTFDAVNPTVVSTDLTASYTGTGPGSFIATFNKALDDPAGNTSTDDVTNSSNYLLVNKGTNGVANTVTCAGGVVADDTRVTLTIVAYNNVTFTATVTLAGPLPVGSYRLFICGTTSIVDLAGNPLNGGTDYTFDFVVQAVQPQGGGNTVSASQQTSLIPATGFPQNKITPLPIQSADKAYASTDFWLEIPKLGVKLAIVGVPKTKDGWDVTWLNKAAGWLNGSAYPTWNGNSVITAHVWDALNKPGPFAQLKSLKYGDQVKIHAFGMVYTYEITESSLITNADAKLAFKHEAKPVITLITCEDYNETSDTYTYRRMVRAVLVSVTKEK